MATEYVRCQGEVSRGDYVKLITVIGQDRLYRKAEPSEIVQSIAVDNSSNGRVPIVPLDALRLRQCAVSHEVKEISKGQEVKSVSTDFGLPYVVPCDASERTDLFADCHGDRGCGILVRALPGASFDVPPREVPVVDQAVHAVLLGYGWTQEELR